MPLPPLSFSSGPNISGPANAGGGGVTLGNYQKGLSTEQILIFGALALIAIKLVK